MIRVLYRGESYSNLKSKLNIVGDAPDYRRVSDFVFLIGEKGRAYRREYRNRIRNKGKIFSIDDTTDLIFRYIFNKFNRCLAMNSRVVSDFTLRNQDFTNFFLSNANLKKFLDAISRCDDSRRLAIRDFYLQHLHRLGVVGYFNNSIFVSSSEDFLVAKSFATSQESESIIFVTWSVNRKGTMSHAFGKPRKNLPSGLPSLRTSFYPQQKEHSIKGGILPHFLFGYIRPTTRVFELNPNLFNVSQNVKEKIMDGFMIDQSQFSSKLRETDYEIFFSVDGSGRYWDFTTQV